MGLFLVENGMKVESETERNHRAHDHDHEINFCPRGNGAVARPEDSDDARHVIRGTEFCR